MVYHFQITIPELEEEVAQWQRDASSNLGSGGGDGGSSDPDSAWLNWVVSWREQGRIV